tara:strand:- start:987 stop:3392 length:2406 start_codon:yes stop_codon:yes gene_type:complete
MATTVDTLLIRIQTDMKGVRRDLDKIQRTTKQSTDKMNKSFAGVGKVFKVAMVAVVVRQAAQAAIALTKLASGVEEMQAKSSVVFGKFAEDFRQFTAELGKATGRSRFELEAMGATVQDTFVPMGFAREEAKELSKQLVTLAVDVASFNNKADDEVMRAFQSALVGNHMTLRQFGVVITQATLGQELFTMGIEGGIKAATNAQKVQARLNLIVKGTSDAQGDAVRTGNSYANRVKEMKAALNDLGVEIGTTLMPFMKTLVQTMTELTHATSGFLKDLGLIADTDLGKLKRLEGQIKAIKEAMLVGDGKTSLLDAMAVGDTKTKKALVALFKWATSKGLGGNLADSIKGVIGNPDAEQEFFADTVLGIMESQEEVLRKKLALEEKITNQVKAQMLNSPRSLDARRGEKELRIEEEKLKNIKDGFILQQKLMYMNLSIPMPQHNGAPKQRTLGNQQVGTSSILTDVDKALFKHREEQDKNKSESRRAHDIKMTQLTVELNKINAIQTSLETNTKLSKSSRQQNMFEKLQSESNKHHADTNFTGQDRQNLNIMLALEADALVDIEMANEANAKRNDLRKIGINLTEQNISVIDKLKKQQASLNELKEAELITDELHQKLMGQTIQQLKELEPMYKIITDGLKQVADTISQTFADAFMSGKLSLDSLANLVKSTVAKMIAHILKMQVIAPILSALGMKSSTMEILGFGKLAGGGTMQANRPHLVGERGPELFVPSGAGTLMNNMNTKNAMGGGGMVINQSINVSTGVAQTVRAEIANLLPAIRNDTMRAVADGKRRGGSFAKAIG